MERIDPILMVLAIAVGFPAVSAWHSKYRPHVLYSNRLGLCFLFIRIVFLVGILGLFARATGFSLLIVLAVSIVCSVIILALMSAGISFTGDILFTFTFGWAPFEISLAILIPLLLPMAGLQFMLLGTEGLGPKAPSEKEGTGHTPKPPTVRPEEDPALIGRMGVAATALRPSGKVKVDGHLYDAVSDSMEFIERGENVVIKARKLSALEVERMPMAQEQV